MSEAALIKTVLKIVDEAVEQIEQMEPGDKFEPKTFLIAGGGAWAVPISWKKIKWEVKTEVAAVQKVQRYAREIGANVVVTMMFERYRRIKTISCRGEEADNFKRNDPLVLLVNVKNAGGHLVHMLSFETNKGRHRASKRLWGEVNNGYRR
jgi:hypothetical protein